MKERAGQILNWVIVKSELYGVFVCLKVWEHRTVGQVIVWRKMVP